jgi:hypothetical protein
MFKRPLIYVQVHRGHFIAKRIGSDRVVRKSCAGLDHPRTLMGDFQVVADGFSSAYKELYPAVRFFKPRALVHLIPVFEGGYTNVELRAFNEASAVAGAAFTFMSTFERPHTDAELAEILG